MKMLTDRQAAERYCVTPKTIRNWTAQGRFPQPVRIGGAVRWNVIDLDRFDAAGCIMGTETTERAIAESAVSK